MKRTLNELVNVILRHLEEDGDTVDSESGLRTWLAGQGYKKRDIEAAIKLIGPQFKELPLPGRSSQGTVRHLSTFEAHKLSPEVRDAIARLEMYELITPFEREILLDRLAQTEGEVGMEDLDYMVSWLVCSTRDVESQQAIYHVFENNREMFH